MVIIHVYFYFLHGATEKILIFQFGKLICMSKQQILGVLTNKTTKFFQVS